MRRILPKYEIWIGEEHKEHTILEIRAERLGEYVDRGERRSLIYRVYRKAGGNILVHVYDRADVAGDRTTGGRARSGTVEEKQTPHLCGAGSAVWC